MDHSYLERNISGVRQRITAACERAGREGVTMVAAVKYADIDEINYLHDHLGVTDIGENRVQQLLEHYEGLNDRSVNIHFIGTLQTNKVKYIVDKVCMIHSVDSVKLAAEIDRQAKNTDVLWMSLWRSIAARSRARAVCYPRTQRLFAWKYQNLRIFPLRDL
jgi:uncharacterized pyridoxal phosphate-containing UPF0001 family protein